MGEAGVAALQLIAGLLRASAACKRLALASLQSPGERAKDAGTGGGMQQESSLLR